MTEERDTETGGGGERLREMRFLEHLEELRSVLFASALAWIAASAVLWFFSARMLDLLLEGLPVKQLYFYSPAEAFMIRMKISFVLGFLATFPYIFLRAWRFVSPALFAREKRLVLPLVVSSAALFYGGLAFAYFAMLPIVIDFFVNFGTERLTPLLSVDRYFAFVAKLSFSFGAVFQMPLVIVVLTWIGLVSARSLLRQWRWAIIIIFIVAAVFTPPDPISQIFMGVPLCALYFGSVAVSFLIERRRRRGEEKGAD